MRSQSCDVVKCNRTALTWGSWDNRCHAELTSDTVIKSDKSRNDNTLTSTSSLSEPSKLNADRGALGRIRLPACAVELLIARESGQRSVCRVTRRSEGASSRASATCTNDAAAHGWQGQAICMQYAMFASASTNPASYRSGTQVATFDPSRFASTSRCLALHTPADLESRRAGRFSPCSILFSLFEPQSALVRLLRCRRTTR